MKKILNISLLITVFVVLISNCKNNSERNNVNISEREKDSDVQDSETDSVQTKLTKYDKKWVEYVDENGLKLRELELYISEFGDTLCWNKKIYKNGILDLTQSHYYDFQAKMAKDSIIKGRITMYSELDHSIKDPIEKRELTVDFVNQLNGKKKLISFESKNKNYVDFEFKNDNDTIIGLLTEFRQIELLKSPDSVRMIWTKLPIDSKSPTNNVFINVHELDKNKR